MARALADVSRRVVVPVVMAGVLTATPAADASAAERLQQSKVDLAQMTLEDLMKLEVTTGAWTTATQSDLPARVVVITADQIARRNYRSLLDVLQDLADFKVDLRSNWDFPVELTVDGVRGAGRVLVLLDGIRVSAPTNEPLPIAANYPVHTARQIEIVYGPASAVYGADAFSAVINIITRSETEGMTASTSVGTSGLYDQSASFGVRLGTGVLHVAGQYQYDGQPDLSRAYPADFGGLQAQHAGVFPTVFGPMIPIGPVSPGYHIPMWAQSVQASYRNGGLKLLLFENRSHLPATAGLYTPDNVVYDGDAFLENGLVVLAASYTRDLGAVKSASTLTFSRHELDPTSGYRDLYSNMTRSYKYAYGSMMKVEQQFVWNAADNLSVASGGTVERFFAIPQTADLNAPVQSQESPGTILGTDIVDDFYKLHYANVGAFVEARYAAAPAFVVTAGGRGDYNTRFGGTFNPRIGLIARASRTTTVKLLYGTAYLAPSPYQEYQHYGSFLSQDGGKTFESAYWHVPNPALKPEHKSTVEATVQQRIGADVRVSASIFRSRFSNLIQPADVDKASSGEFHGWPVAYLDIASNEGRETTYGGSLAVDLMKSFGPRRQLAARADLSLADGRIWPFDENDTSLPIGGMAPVQWRFGADLDWYGFSLAPRVTIVGRQRLSAPTEDGSARQTLDGFWTADVSIRQTVARHVDVFASILNAFDRRYRAVNERAYLNPEEFIGVPQNPRRIAAGLTFRLP